ncbi:MAG: hypothetical protein ACRYGO_03975 [Janthinobacterium lividum]
MTPQNKLRLANVLMLAGLVPLTVSMVRMVSAFPAARHVGSHIGDALMTIGFAYLFALLVSSAGAGWSFMVEKRHGQVEVGGTNAIRVLVLMALIGPFVFGSF